MENKKSYVSSKTSTSIMRKTEKLDNNGPRIQINRKHE